MADKLPQSITAPRGELQLVPVEEAQHPPLHLNLSLACFRLVNVHQRDVETGYRPTEGPTVSLTDIYRWKKYNGSHLHVL